MVRTRSYNNSRLVKYPKKKESPWKDFHTEKTPQLTNSTKNPIVPKDIASSSSAFRANTSDNTTPKMEESSKDRIKSIVPDLVFKGTKYSAWRHRINNMLVREGYLKLLVESKEETDFIDDQDRINKQTDYYVRQENAKGLVFDLLDTKYFERVFDCITIRQVLSKLDRELIPSTKVGLINARLAYHTMVFNKEGDLKEYIEKHEHKCYAFIEAGGKTNDEEKVDQLSSSLPDLYDSALEWWTLQPEEARTYDLYRMKLIEKYERKKHSNDLRLSKFNQQKKSFEKPETSTKNDNGGSLFCKYCKAKDHVVSDCSKLKKKLESENGPAQESQEKPSVPPIKKDQPPSGTDSSKFGSSQKQTPRTIIW